LHVTQRGVNKCACFACDRDYQLYLGLLEELAKRHSCAVHAYVLMTNHVHMLLTPSTSDGPSSLMKHLGQRYVQAFNKRHKRSGTLWEGRFKSCIVDSETYLLRCHRYIEENPVRAAMIGHPRQYPWSSYRSNAEGLPSALVTPHPLYMALASTAPQRILRYRELFNDPVFPGDTQAIRAAANSGLPLGSGEFVESLGRQLNRRVALRKSGRPPKQLGDNLRCHPVESEAPSLVVAG
jgi:putative transposase